MRLTRFARHWPKWALRLRACRAATISGATTVVWRAPFLTDGGLPEMVVMSGFGAQLMKLFKRR